MVAEMSERILVTGGAGFIGSHIVDALLARGYVVTVLDVLDPQVHDGKRPDYLAADAEFVQGDIRDRDLLAKLLPRCDAVVHQAASVGVGQSMYEIHRYVDNNTLATASLLEAIVAERSHIRKVVVASSMSIYGEGKYQCPECTVKRPANRYVAPELRTNDQLERREWELRCPSCGSTLEPVGCDELKPLRPTSVYAITKRDHEELVLSVGRAYGIPSVALRYFNTYGPRQALSNPYTGVAAIFAGQLRSKSAPLVFEDGLQSRDFVYVGDIAQANVLALASAAADYQAVNVGSGTRTNLLRLLELLRERLDPHHEFEPVVNGRFREGDIRHCFADITKARTLLGYEPRMQLDSGIDILVEWAGTQKTRDASRTALAELEARRLIR
jgi:dTDP-L-rhamnose 4-epimerase